jgi:hypothetical protein
MFIALSRGFKIFLAVILVFSGLLSLNAARAFASDGPETLRGAGFDNFTLLASGRRTFDHFQSKYAFI